MEKYLNNRFLYMRKLLKTPALMQNLFITRKALPQISRMERKKLKRKTIWFTSSYSSTIKSNVGKPFLKLVKQHLPKGLNLNYIKFNKNTIKVSSRCLKKMGSVLSRQNSKTLSRKEDQYGCNCRKKG